MAEAGGRVGRLTRPIPTQTSPHPNRSGRRSGKSSPPRHSRPHDDPPSRPPPCDPARHPSRRRCGQKRSSSLRRGRRPPCRACCRARLTCRPPSPPCPRSRPCLSERTAPPPATGGGRFHRGGFMAVSWPLHGEQHLPLRRGAVSSGRFHGGFMAVTWPLHGEQHLPLRRGAVSSGRFHRDGFIAGATLGRREGKVSTEDGLAWRFHLQRLRVAGRRAGTLTAFANPSASCSALGAAAAGLQP